MKGGRLVILANPSSEWMLECQNVVVLDGSQRRYDLWTHPYAVEALKLYPGYAMHETELIRLALQPTIYFLALPSHRAWFWVILQVRLLSSLQCIVVKMAK